MTTLTKVVRDKGTALIGEVLGERARVDAWVNDFFGMGTERDPSVYTRQRVRGLGLSDENLEALFVEDPLAKRAVVLLVAWALFKGWDLPLPGKPQEAAAQTKAYAMIEDDLRVRRAFGRAWMWSRLFGGSLTWIGVDDGLGDAQWKERQAEPLDMAKIDRVRFVQSYDRRDVVVEETDGDPLSPTYREPKFVRIWPAHVIGAQAAVKNAEVAGGGIRVHASRLIIWPGAPTTDRRIAERMGWDDSELEAMWLALQQLGEDDGAKSGVLWRAATFVFGVTNLGALLSGDRKKLRDRVNFLQMNRRSGKPVVIDTKERVENVAQSLPGTGEIIDKDVERVAVAAGVPYSVFIGKPTKDELEAWWIEVERAQGEVLVPRVERLAEIILASKKGPTAGTVPDAWSVVCRPLRTPTPTEQAELRKKQAETDQIEINAGILFPESVALHRHSDTSSGRGEVMLGENEIKARIKRREDIANKPPKDNAELGTVSARAGGGVLEVLAKLNAGTIARSQAKALLMQTFTLTDADAEAQMGTDAEVAAVRAQLAASAEPAKPGPAPEPPKGEGAGAPQGAPNFNAGGNPTKDRLPPEGGPG